MTDSEISLWRKIRFSMDGEIEEIPYEKIDIEKILQEQLKNSNLYSFFSKNNLTQLISGDFSESYNDVLKKANGINFELPLEPYLIYELRLNGNEFDENALLFSNKKYTLRNYSKSMQYLESQEFLKKLSSLIPFEIISSYSGDLFQIPVFEIYKNGNSIKKSIILGREEYDPNYYDKMLCRHIKESNQVISKILGIN